MTKRASKKAADATAGAGVEGPPARTVKFVVSRPYSAGEPYDIVEAEVTHEYEDEADLLRLRLISPPRGVEPDVKRAPRSDRREPGTWFEEPAGEEVTSGEEG
jgi:hypothetical protein